MQSPSATEHLENAARYGLQWSASDSVQAPPRSQTIAIELRPPAEISFTRDAPVIDVALDCAVLLQLRLSLWKWTPYKAGGAVGETVKHLCVSTQGSRVLRPAARAAGAAVTPEEGFRPEGANGKLLFGPYIESVTVELSLDRPHPLLEQHAPDPDRARGGESKEWGIDFNLGAGFCGEAPTGGVGVNFSYRTSYSINLTDFQLHASSDVQGKSLHTFALAMKGDGSRYEGADSLDSSTGGPDTLPARAFSDLPFFAEAFWELPNVDDEIHCTVRVTVVYAAVSGYGYELAFPGQEQRKKSIQASVQWERVLAVPLAKVNRGIDPKGEAEDATPHSELWSEGDTPSAPPQTRSIPFRNRPPSGSVIPPDAFVVDCTVFLQLSLRLWTWTPYTRPDVPGQTVKIVSVSTDGSRVLRPTLTANGAPVTRPEAGWREGADSKLLFGPYIESVTVEMGFDGQDALLLTYSPTTDIAQGGESENHGISFGFNAGFFGAEPTGGVSVGYSYSTSHSIDLTDYALRAQSDARTNRSRHVLALAMKGNGARYEGAESLDSSSAGPDTLPARAFGDLPFTVEGLWELPDPSLPNPFPAGSRGPQVPPGSGVRPRVLPSPEAQLHVRVTVVCAAVSGYGYTLAFSDHDEAHKSIRPTFVWERVIPVPLTAAN